MSNNTNQRQTSGKMSAYVSGAFTVIVLGMFGKAIVGNENPSVQLEALKFLNEGPKIAEIVPFSKDGKRFCSYILESGNIVLTREGPNGELEPIDPRTEFSVDNIIITEEGECTTTDPFNGKKELSITSYDLSESAVNFGVKNK